MTRRFSLAVLLFLCAAVARAAEEAPLPPGDAKPLLQLEAGGPTAAVTALLFSPGGNTLYAAGLDKVVRVWEHDADKKPAWTLKRSFRVPIGPGATGAINALALSPDGRWLAVGGRSVMRGESEFHQPGLVVPIAALSEAMWRDGGTIYVFDQRNPAGGKVLRGHQGEVRALTFAPERAGKPPLLVSAAYEYHGGQRSGAVRLWNAEKGGDALAVLDKLPALQETPGLAVWHTGDGVTDVRALIAWPENAFNSGKGRLRLWDAATGTEQRWQSGSGNATAAFLGFSEGEPRVAVGSVRKDDDALTGRLRVIQYSRDQDTKANAVREVDLDFDRVSYRPLALTAVSGQANGRFDHVAAVLQAGKEDSDNVLTLTAVAANPATVRVRFPLKNSDPNNAPVVAAAPRGKWLAVAGFMDRAIEIYSVEDLLARKTAALARLQSKGVLYSKAMFVRRDKEMGLWLSVDAEAEPLSGGAFFSFDERRLTNDAKGWTNDTPNRAGWKVDFKTGPALVTHGDTVYPKMALQAGQQPTRFALLPATPQRKQALLAVAHTNRDTAETYITLFDVATGRALRQFTGHLQEVRWLAFSDTHPLLVSASEDQTISVWNFADLNAGVGMLEGLVVSERDGKVVVRSVEPNSAAAKAGLKADDVIEGFAAGEGKVQPVSSAVDFYWSVNLKKPGDPVDVKIAGKQPIRIVIGHGVDERKPLLSLFVTRDRREWIGWTPGGPFDRSSPNVNALIGWHINTGKPEQPVTFDTAKEDKGEFYKPNILKYLVARGSLAGALEELEKEKQKEPPPEAVLSPGVDGGKRDPQRADLFLVRQKNVKLTAALINAAYKLDPGDEVRWQAVKPDGEKTPPQPMKRLGDGERAWEADLSMLPWKQGDFRIEILFNSEKNKMKTSKTLTLRYQPPAPRLAATINNKEIPADWEKSPFVVKDAKIVLDVSVKPEPGQTVEVRFLQSGAQDAPKSKTVVGDEKFGHEFTLQEGVNDLEIVAVNKDALPGFELNETSVLRVRVQYETEKPPPRIAALRLTPATAEQFRDNEGREVRVVTVPRIAVISAIEGAETLSVADWSVGDEKAKSLLDPESPKKLDVRQTVDLKAGKTTTLRLRATTKTSKPAEVVLRVLYRPLLPRLAIAGVEEGTEVFRNEATIQGLFRPGTPNEAYQFTVRVTDAQGREVGKAKVDVDEKNRKWTAVVPLVRGENLIEAAVKSEWRPAVTERITITYKRPPVIDPVAEIKVGDKPFVTFEANVWSPSGVKLLGATIDDREWSAVEFRETDELKDGLKRWTVTLKNVPVREGKEWLKTLVLNVRNADGSSRKPATIAIKPPDKPAPVAPLVELQIRDQDTTTTAKYRVPIFVQSDSPLKSVELWRGDELLYKSDLKNVKPSGTKFELRETPEITLDWEANRLRLLAVNDGGLSAKKEAVVSLPRPPVRVLVDKLDILEPNGDVKKALEPRDPTWEQVRFDELPRGFVFLHGHVEWADDKAEQLDAAQLNVVVYVNGARQFPVDLELRGNGKQRNQRAFHVPMVLTKAKDNRIEIELPSLKQETASRREFSLDCAQAMNQQRLHVLIVGVNVEDGDKLKTNVLAMLGKDPPRGLEGEFKSEAFQRAYLAGVLYENVQKEALFGKLGDIAKVIRDLQKQTGWQNDVVLIYFQGNEANDPRGQRYLKTTKNERYPVLPLDKTAIAYNDLTPMPGVQIMVLNVTRPTKPGDAVVDLNWRLPDPHVGVLRYVWRDAEETRNPSPKTVTYLDKAMKRGASKFGEIADDATNQVKKDENALAQESFAQLPDAIKEQLLSKPR